MTDSMGLQSSPLQSDNRGAQIRTFTTLSQMHLKQMDEPTSSTPDHVYKNKKDQKRRPKPKDGTVLNCQICGDRALGYNFDAITCESCKAFFRRNALKMKVFTCSFEGNCKLDPHTRKFCTGCRLKKCFDVGMKKDWILGDDQLAKRRKKSNDSHLSENVKVPLTKLMQFSSCSSPQLSDMASHKINTCSPQGNSSNSEMNSSSYLSDSTEHNSLHNSSFTFTDSNTAYIKHEIIDEEDCPQPLPPNIAIQLEDLIKEYQLVFDSGYSEEQAKRMVEKPHSANDLFNMTDIFIRRLIKFSKHIPEFKMLMQEDQIYLLKGGIMEILVLRSAVGYDPADQKWKVRQKPTATEHNIDPSIIKEQLGYRMYQDHVKLVQSLHELTRSNATVMILMFVIEIFTPDRLNLKNIEAVTNARDKFSLWLQLYLESIMPVREARVLHQKLRMKLLDIRSLGESGAKLASNLDITKLEPLLIEVFSLQN